MKKITYLYGYLLILITQHVYAIDNIANALDNGANDARMIAKSMLAFAILFAGGRIMFSKSRALDEIGPIFWGGLFIFSGVGIILWLSSTLGS